MNAMMATVEMARRYEDVADGFQLAQLLARMVTARVRAWLGRLPEGIEESIAGLQLGSGRVAGVGRLDA
jgi:hypothetical protein